MNDYAAIVIGGGFFGASVAEYLKTRRGFGRVLVVERGDRLMGRASYTNQARVHAGYHYPRSYTTARRSWVNLPRFRAEFGPVVFDGFTALYALARRNSKVTPRQMERLCSEIWMPLGKAAPEHEALFDKRLIAEVYHVDEQAFNADRLRTIMHDRLAKAGVEVWTRAHVTGLVATEAGYEVHLDREGQPLRLGAALVVNCTYACLQQLARQADAPNFALKHEVTEISLVEPPEELREVGITVMDGPFFSIMPFPARGLHSLTHVRYTPQRQWIDAPGIDPLAQLAQDPQRSAVDWMIRDSARYVPAVGRAMPRDQLFEVKTVLLKSESDDSRPILFERHGVGGRVLSILGGKLDNVFDILERLDAEKFPEGVN